MAPALHSSPRLLHCRAIRAVMTLGGKAAADARRFVPVDRAAAGRVWTEDALEPARAYTPKEIRSARDAGRRSLPDTAYRRPDTWPQR
jgi:xanthine dehydrogenase iron-sulfur cluster and FAD-binding subunit A